MTLLEHHRQQHFRAKAEGDDEQQRMVSGDMLELPSEETARSQVRAVPSLQELHHQTETRRESTKGLGMTATAEKNVMHAENQVHKLFLKFAGAINDPERNDFFHPANRDLWLGTFARWLEEQAGKFGCSND